MCISVRSNIDEVLSFTKPLHPQYWFAVPKALTAVAGDVRNELTGEMSRVLDPSTRWMPAAEPDLIFMAQLFAL